MNIGSVSRQDVCTALMATAWGHDAIGSVYEPCRPHCWEAESCCTGCKVDRNQPSGIHVCLMLPWSALKQATWLGVRDRSILNPCRSKGCLEYRLPTSCTVGLLFNEAGTNVIVAKVVAISPAMIVLARPSSTSRNFDSFRGTKMPRWALDLLDKANFIPITPL